MEFDIGIYEKFQMLTSYFITQIQQYRLTTKDHEVVNTLYGKVRGVKHKNVYGVEHSFYAFEGIPYAKPPLEELRFRAPQPAEPWDGILNCTRHKSKPKQVNLLFGFDEGSEDCLHLNIFAKKLNSDTPLPVMVWIYGGGFQYGEATPDCYSPDYFMMQDVIVVTFNYRLGVFGFLCLDDPDLNIPGNAGIKDQVLALQWIKGNIHHFNGDPNNITVFGESAGGVSTHMLMMSPQAKGLFHKAIVQSGSALCPWACTDRHDWGYKLACHLGYEGANNDKDVYGYLLNQSGSRLAGNHGVLLTKHDILINNLFFAFAPVIEPYTTKGCITNKPFKELLRNAWGNAIPLIIGGNTAEGLFYYNYTMKFPYVMDELAELGCVHLLPDEVKRDNNTNVLERMSSSLKLVYFNGETPNRNEHLFPYLELMGHRAFWLPVYRTLRARSAYARNVPTYCYAFDFDSPTFNYGRKVLCSDANVRGTCHGDDLYYFFRNAFSGPLSTSQREFKCIERMVGMWYNFALSSNPNCKEIKPKTWKPVQNGNQKHVECLIINDEVEFKPLPSYAKLKAWADFYPREAFI